MNNPYHGAANAIGGDDDIEEINELLTEIHLAHNANAETTNTELAALCAAVASTRQALVATQQQIALMAQANTQRQAQTLPAWQQTHPAAYQPPPVHQPIPPAPAQQAAYAAIPPPASPAYQSTQAYVLPVGRGGARQFGGRGRGGGRFGRGGRRNASRWHRLHRQMPRGRRRHCRHGSQPTQRHINRHPCSNQSPLHPYSKQRTRQSHPLPPGVSTNTGIRPARWTWWSEAIQR